MNLSGFTLPSLQIYFSSHLHTLTNILKTIQAKYGLEFQTYTEGSGEVSQEEQNFK